MQEAGRETFDGEESAVVSEKTEAAKPAPTAKNRLNSAETVRWLYGAVGLVVIASILSWLQFSTRAICCGDYDGYYHIRWSSLLWQNFSQGKWLPDFVWLPLTVLSPESYDDHHFLFHLLQIPFLWFFEPIMAAKVAAVVFATAAVFSCYWLILRYRIEYPLVWLLGLLTCASPFYYRMNMAKAPPIAIIFTVLGIYLLFQRRYIWLLPLMFFFVWTYSLFLMLCFAAFIWTVIIAWNENRLEWRPLAYSVAGMIAGNVINPYFPRNLYLFFEHAATKLRTQYDVPVGGEWYAYESNVLLGSCAVAFLAMVVGFVLYRADERKLEEKSTFFLVFTTFFMVWIFQSKRIAEYFPPLAILFAAFAFNAFNLRKLAGETALPEDFQRDIAPYLDKPVQAERDEERDVWKTAFVGLVCVILLVWMFFTFRGLEIESRKIDYKGLVADITGNDPPEKYQRAMEWAVANIPAGERIFNTDWDDFPKLFFHDQKHSYVAGLDPNYLYSRNPELWKEFEAITTGKTGDFAATIRDKFGARYVFSDNNHDDFYGKALDSGWFEKIYEDDESFILKIRDQKGEPPTEANGANDAGANDEPAADDADTDADETEDAPENTPNK